MTYYLGRIMERNGDFEYTDMYLFKTNGDPHKFAERTAMEWRGGDEENYDDAHDGYWSDCTLIFNSGYTAITEDEFRVLNKFIPVMM